LKKEFAKVGGKVPWSSWSGAGNGLILAMG
jgi:hypothetical protein